MHHHERTRLGGNFHRPEERLVVDHKCALVRHEELVGGDALLGESRKLLERAALSQIRDRHVVAHVDDLLALRLPAPLLERVREGRARRLDHEVDVTGRTAERGSGLARRDVVDRHRPAEGHVEVGMRVDAAREHVLAGRIDQTVRIDIEGLSDHRDPLTVDEHVADVVIGGGDDPATLDQYRHVTSHPSCGESSGPAPVVFARSGAAAADPDLAHGVDPELTPRRYFPPSVGFTTAGL
jgi:hypothetical protein